MRNASSAGPLFDFSNEWTFLTQQMLGVNSTNVTMDSDLVNMVKIPRNKIFRF